MADTNRPSSLQWAAVPGGAGRGWGRRFLPAHSSQVIHHGVGGAHGPASGSRPQASFTAEETEAQRGEAAGPRSHRNDSNRFQQEPSCLLQEAPWAAWPHSAPPHPAPSRYLTETWFMVPGATYLLPHHATGRPPRAKAPCRGWDWDRAGQEQGPGLPLSRPLDSCPPGLLAGQSPPWLESPWPLGVPA